MLFIAFEFDELLGAGDRLLASARYEEALDYYVRVLRIDDESYEGQMGAGRACYQLRRFDEAAEHFSAAVATAPDDAASLVSLALCHSERGRRDEAIIYAERATVIDDTYLHAFTTLARLCHQARQYRRSLEALGAARRIAPDHLEVLYNTGVIHRVLGDNEASVEVLFEAASRYPHNAIVMKELARALHACGNLDAAADFFGRSIQLAPDDPEAHCDLGRLQGETGNHRDAVRHFKRALELDPTLAAAYCSTFFFRNSFDHLDHSYQLFRRFALFQQGVYACLKLINAHVIQAGFRSFITCLSGLRLLWSRCLCLRHRSFLFGSRRMRQRGAAFTQVLLICKRLRFFNFSNRNEICLRRARLQLVGRGV